jgi:hypothetical protein
VDGELADQPLATLAILLWVERHGPPCVLPRFFGVLRVFVELSQQKVGVGGVGERKRLPIRCLRGRVIARFPLAVGYPQRCRNKPALRSGDSACDCQAD